MPHLRAINLYKNELSFLNRTRILILSVNQSVGKVKKNTELQNVITLKLIGTGRKNFTFITY
jgi:hypothetical protein